LEVWVALFRLRRRQDRAQDVGSALELWQLDQASALPRNGGPLPGAAPATRGGGGPRPEGADHDSEPAPRQEPTGRQGAEDGRQAPKIDEIEDRHADAREHSDRALEDAHRLLESLETQAGEAETHAARAERLANELSRYREQEAAFRTLIEKIKAAEGRAVAADERARAALERIPQRRDRKARLASPRASEPTTEG
jgi:hypothetical protein